MTAGRSDLVEITCHVRHVSKGAWLIDDGTRKVWVPKSQVEIHSPTGLGGGCSVAVMPEWLALEKELI